MPLPGVSRLVCVASKEFPRYSEGDVVELSDGRLLLALARKKGSSDFAEGTIIGFFSRDRGVSWDDEPQVIQAIFDDVIDVMSVSLCRSPRGVHLFFLGRGTDAKHDTRIYQLLSADEGKTWSKPVRVNQRTRYHVVNNARVIRTSKGRMIVPSAFLDGDWDAQHDRMGVYCLFSDDDGGTWKTTSDLALAGHPLMEPGVAECGDGSLYMTIRTTLGVLYEARSRDQGATWTDLRPTKLPSPAAPSTVFRDPTSDDLWMFWINRAVSPGGGAWKDRNPLSVGISHDQGKSWETVGDMEDDAKHSYGYVSVDVIDRQVLLTYYDWRDHGQHSFEGTNLRQRTIPVDYFRRKAVPPVFQASGEPVLEKSGVEVSCNSGLVVEEGRWRLWYAMGTTGAKDDRLRIHYAESSDRGLSWQQLGPVEMRGLAEKSSAFRASVHRTNDGLIMHVWRRDASDDAGLYRYVSRDDGKTFEAAPAHPLMVSNWTKAKRVAEAGAGHFSNDAFDVLQNEDGTWEYFASCFEKTTDPRLIFKQDNAAGFLRMIGRAISADGDQFSAPEIVIRTDYKHGDALDTQFYGMQVFRRRGFYLGLLQIFHVNSQVIAPEWAWSHDGEDWTRTNVPCISLGDEGAFDNRMIVLGGVVASDKELIWLFAGSDWRHNAFKPGKVRTCIGRATLKAAALDAWLDTLPQP